VIAECSHRALQLMWDQLQQCPPVAVVLVLLTMLLSLTQLLLDCLLRLLMHDAYFGPPACPERPDVRSGPQSMTSVGRYQPGRWTVWPRA
jgi:hypothetical protein